ncbi:MAG: hypothetical protein HUJ30_07225 [Gammaproteobacteria bacterium]|nr:hypothetical protein [Gammaproteobacteria bacterium]
MSLTSQRKDISDPDVLNEFATFVQNQKRLNYLYLLTMADIRATSPNVWNSWKSALLEELYRSTSDILKRGLQNPLLRAELVSKVKLTSLEILQQQNINQHNIEQLWQRLPDAYFVHYSAYEIAWHAQAILAKANIEVPLILIRQQTERGGTEVFIYTPIQQKLFAQTTAVLGKMALTVVDARLVTSTDRYSFNTFMVLEEDGNPIRNPTRIGEIISELKRVLSDQEHLPDMFQRSLSRQLKHFPLQTEVTFNQEPHQTHTVMDVFTMDRPGLLAQLARVFLDKQVRILNAKITTLGERAEDVFFLTDQKSRQPLKQAKQEELRQAIIHSLDGD